MCAGAPRPRLPVRRTRTLPAAVMPRRRRRRGAEAALCFRFRRQPFRAARACRRGCPYHGLRRRRRRRGAWTAVSRAARRRCDDRRRLRRGSEAEELLMKCPLLSRLRRLAARERFRDFAMEGFSLAETLSLRARPVKRLTKRFRLFGCLVLQRLRLFLATLPITAPPDFSMTIAS
jgi:hypothetical protein